MGISENNEKQKQAASISGQGSNFAGQSENGKKSYQPPQLHEYGNVTALTQAMMAGSFADGGTVGMMTMMMTP